MMSTYPVSAQYKPYSPKVWRDGDTLQLPWAGGLDNPVFSNIDLDFDGTLDVFIYEKSGNQKLTFLQKGLPGQALWVYAPQYADAFPNEIVKWMILKDFDCDGKLDIFTGNSTGRILCYKNVSPALGPLQFVLYANPVKTRYPFFTDLSFTTTDLPAWEDVDGDGDLDFLTFGGISTTVEFHRNYAMENYGRCDTLDMRIESDCWGYFSENQFNNNITLGISCKGAVGAPLAGKTMHAGSTIVAFDADGNGTKEVLIGDISYNNMVFLTNGGTLQDAQMTAKDTMFPAYNVPIHMQVFPAAYYVDINNDGARDLVVAPYPENASWNVGNVWYYQNTATDASPVFSIQTDSLLNGQMIDLGTDANVAVLDENADGLPDILIGNFQEKRAALADKSSLSLYRNIGTAQQPEFELVDRDYLQISTLLGLQTAAVFPAVGDIDQDGDIDLILGDMNGFLHVFKNNAGVGNPAQFQLFAAQYNTIDIGAFASPCLADISGDGLPDLIVGKENGTLSYFQNAGGSDGFSFPAIADDAFWGEVDVQPQCCTGYSAPHVFQETGDTAWHLWVGSEQGYIFQYENVKPGTGHVFTKVDSLIAGVYKRGRIRVLRADLNADGKDELITGTVAGGLHLYTLDGASSLPEEGMVLNPVRIFPNPGNGRLHWSGGPLAEPEEIQLYDLQGKNIFVWNTELHNKYIEFNCIAPGLYRVSFQYSGYQQSLLYMHNE